jgi:hypothetical protein
LKSRFETEANRFELFNLFQRCYFILKYLDPVCRLEAPYADTDPVGKFKSLDIEVFDLRSYAF